MRDFFRKPKAVIATVLANNVMPEKIKILIKVQLRVFFITTKRPLTSVTFMECKLFKERGNLLV